MGKNTKYRVLIGAMLINFPNGIPWYFGNIVTYCYSYFRVQLEDSNVYSKIVWLLPLFCIMTVVGMTTVDFLRRIFSMRITLLIAIICYDGCLFISYFSVQYSIWATELTFSVGPGYGHGVMLVLNYVYASQWFYNQIGIATSAVAATCGIGALACTFITTSFLNPDNLKPDERDDSFLYFTSQKIVDAFPTLFLILATFSTICHIIGFFLLEVPSPNDKISVDYDENRNRKDDLSEETAIHVEFRSYVQEINSNQSETKNPARTSERNNSDNNSGMKSNEVNGGNHRTPSNISVHSTDKNPLQALRTERFYVNWFAMLSMTFGYLSVTSCYKLFGQIWIHDDTFLAFIGGIADIATFICRLGFGLLLDRLGVVNAIIGVMATNTICMSLLYFVVRLNRWVYVIWTSYLIGVQSSTYTIFPVAILKCFGRTYYATNWGLLMTSLLTASLVTPSLMSSLVLNAGWFWFFFFCSASCALAMVVFIMRIPKELTE